MTTKLDLLTTKVYTTEAGVAAQAIGLLPLSEVFQNDPNLMHSLIPLSEKTVLILDAINRTRKKSVLEEYDAKRDDDYRNIYYTIKGQTYSSDVTKRNAAIEIMNIYDLFGLNVIKESYSQESAHIEALLLHLATEEAKAAIAQLPGVAESVAGLVVSQAAFTEQYVNYESDKAHQDGYATASELKKEILNIINNQLIPYLQVMNDVSPSDYSEFTAQVMQIVNDANTAVKKRGNKGKAPVGE